MHNLSRGLLLFLYLLLASCVTSPPSNVNNICKIFKQYPSWYHDAKTVERKWRVSIPVQMAIIHQESRFDATARPERTKLLWIIPWTRPSSAYGYTQALKGTWEHYRKTRGTVFSSRDDFGDGVDFVGWYADMAHRKAGINKNNAYELYLAYHEGVGGYTRKTYLKKRWLINVAKKVQRQSWKYEAQLSRCESSLKRKSWFTLW